MPFTAGSQIYRALKVQSHWLFPLLLTWAATPSVLGNGAQYDFTTLAGLAPGSADGTGSAARFNGPYGVAVDSAGNVYLADTDNFTIREVTPAGVVTTVAGTPGLSGSADGTGSAARFLLARGIAVDGSGNIYVADSGNSTIRKITAAGVVTTLAGTAGLSGLADGTGSAARFNSPYGVTVDGSGNIYVADTYNNAIRKVTPAGVVTTIAGTGSSLGSISNPNAVAVDGAENVYVANTPSSTIVKVTAGGIVTTFAGPGSGASFNNPGGVAVDSAGNVYVADTIDDTIQVVTPAGVATTLAGTKGSHGSIDGTGSGARFYFPGGVAVDASGNVYIADTYNDTIRKIMPVGVVTTLAGTASEGSVDGTGVDARFYGPFGVAVDGSDNLYVADTSNSTIRKITPVGVVTTLAGTPSLYGGSADGTGGAAGFTAPGGVAVDASGNVYVADTGNDTIRKITPAGAVSTIAGTVGESGSADGTGRSASFKAPLSVAVDASGIVYVADTGNDTIRKITPAGTVTTLAGTAGGSGLADGMGGAAQFNRPSGVAVDGFGNVYVADTGNNTIRKITPAGTVTTVAGTPGRSGLADGLGTAAGFYAPRGVAVDVSGNVYVADTYNFTIRMITPSGVVMTIGGTAGMAGSSDGTGSAASFMGPAGVAVDASGNVYVADWSNNAVREGVPTGASTFFGSIGGSLVSSSEGGVSAQSRIDGNPAVGTNIAAEINTAGTGGVLIGFISSLNAGFAVDFALSPTDTFSASTITLTGGVSASRTLTFTGSLSGGTISGTIVELSLPFSATLDSSSGSTATVSGFYQAAAGGSSGGTYSIVGTQGEVFALAVTPSGVSAGIGTASGGGTISVVTQTGAVVAGLVTASTNSLTGTITQSGGGTVSFGGSGGAPTFTENPQSETVAIGRSAALNGSATGSPAYQWIFGGTPISGATDSILLVGNTTSGSAGPYACEATNASGSTISATATLTVTTTSNPGYLVNLSARADVGTGNNILIGGFAVGGTGAKQLLVRGTGPALSIYFNSELANPELVLFDNNGAVVATNFGWGNAPVAGASTASESPVAASVTLQNTLGAFAYAAGSSDTAVVLTMPAGNNTAQLSGVGGTSGIALWEIYDADLVTPTARLINISARADVGTGNNILIGGFAVGGSTAETVLIRAIGPGLSDLYPTVFPLSAILNQPVLTILNNSGAVIYSNTIWGGDATIASVFTTTGAFSLNLAHQDSAILVTLPPGNYTAQVSGLNGGTGIALCEIYEVQ